VLAELADWLGVSTFVVYPAFAIIFLGLACGMVGSLVVANRMAFFSDAMAHTAFAGIGIGLLGVILLAPDVRSTLDVDRYLWVVTLVMIAIGLAVGAGIGFVRERTGLSNDTVIGVFFALAIGVGAMLLPEIGRHINVDTERYLFGALILVTERDVWRLAMLALVTAVAVCWRYNSLVFASFNPSLARSRGVRTVANNYLFIAVLVLVVNISVLTIGALLINALLIVPAAAASNIGRNLRQVFWLTLAGCVGCGLLGLTFSTLISIPLGHGRTPLQFAPSGTIVVLCVLWFFATMAWSAIRHRGTGPIREQAR
jgi:zinc transport system permease protein